MTRYNTCPVTNLPYSGIRSAGQGRFIGYGQGRGPIGVPISEKLRTYQMLGALPLNDNLGTDYFGWLNTLTNTASSLFPWFHSGTSVGTGGSTPPPPPSPQPSGFPTGLVIGGIAGTIGLGLLIYFLVRRK